MVGTTTTSQPRTGAPRPAPRSHAAAPRATSAGSSRRAVPGSTSAVSEALAANRLLRTGPTEQVAALETALRDGAFTSAGETIGGTNLNGALALGTIRHGTSTVPVVIKPATADAAQEAFASSIARDMGIDYLVPRAVPRADGSVAMERVPGYEFLTSSVYNDRSLETALRRSYQVQHPELPARDMARAARIDRQLVQVFDYVLANSDRHQLNGLRDRPSGRISFIDQGNLAHGETADPLRPRLNATYQPAGPGEAIPVDEDVRTILRERLTPERIAAAHAAFDRPAPEGTVARHWFEQARDPEYLDRVQQRVRQVVEQGTYEFAGSDGWNETVPGVEPRSKLASARANGASVVDAVQRRLAGFLTTLR